MYQQEETIMNIDLSVKEGVQLGTTLLVALIASKIYHPVCGDI